MGNNKDIISEFDFESEENKFVKDKVFAGGRISFESSDGLVDLTKNDKLIFKDEIDDYHKESPLISNYLGEFHKILEATPEVEVVSELHTPMRWERKDTADKFLKDIGEHLHMLGCQLGTTERSFMQLSEAMHIIDIKNKEKRKIYMQNQHRAYKSLRGGKNGL